MTESNNTTSAGPPDTSAPTANANIDIEKLTEKVYQLMQADIQRSIGRGITPLPNHKRRK